jgi:malate synthase
VAHPGLVPVALRAFDKHMPGPNQISRQRDDVNVTAADLLSVPTGTVTTEGLRSNIRVGIQYLEAWLNGNGCVPLYNLMEDAATAEISRSQVWQWLRYHSAIAGGAEMTPELYETVLPEELKRIEMELGAQRFGAGHFPAAAKLFSEMSRHQAFTEFLTLPGYELLP